MLLDRPVVGFAQRQNPDGTVDVICLRCFDTVASVASMAAQRPAEGLKTEHVCRPFGSVRCSAA